MWSSIWKTHDNCVGSISLTRRTRNLKKRSRTRVRSWKHQWLLLCPAKLWTRIVGVVNPVKSNQNLRKNWKLVNLQDCVWESHCQIIMKTILQEKVRIHYSITIWFTNLFLCLKLWKFRQRKQRWTRNGKNWKKISAWNLTKVRSKKEVIDEARTAGATVHFASSMAICHLKNAELEAKHQKYKGRVVLFSITNDRRQDHGYHLQIAWLRWTSSRRSISVYPSENGRCSQIISKFQKRSVQTFGFVYHDTNGQNHGPVLKTQSFLLNEICTVIFWKDCYGKGNLRKSYCSTVGKRFPIGNVSLYIVKKDCFICLCGWHQIGWKGTKHWSDVESTQWRCRFGRTNIFPWSCVPGLHSKTMWNKQRYCGQVQSHVREISYFFVVLLHWRACQEMCGTMLWASKQDDSTTLQSIYSMHRWPPLQRRRIEIRGRIVKCMLSNCSEMLILGTNWKTWYSMVSKWPCTIKHKMDQGLWQTPESTDFKYSSYLRIQTIVSCG